MGTFMATLVVFLLFVVVSQSVGYYRSRWQIADVEGESGGDVRRSAAVGIASGLIVLFLLVTLYLGFTRWQWLGPPPTHSNSPVVSPVGPGNQAVPPIGANVSPAPSSGASPAPTPSH